MRRAALLIGFILALALTCTHGQPPTTPIESGGALYAAHCASCHGDQGEGVAAQQAPRLAWRLAAMLKVSGGREYLPRAIAFGMQGSIVADNALLKSAMPAHSALSDMQIAELVNYLLFGLNAAQLSPHITPYNESEVARLRATYRPPEEITATRTALAERLQEIGLGAEFVVKPDTSITRITTISGAALDYSHFCHGCHGADGVSVPGKFPVLKQRVGYFLHVPEGREYLIRVPGVATAALSDERLAAVMNWMLRNFSAAQLPRDFVPYSAAEVKRLRARPLTALRDERRKLVYRLLKAGIAADGW